MSTPNPAPEPQASPAPSQPGPTTLPPFNVMSIITFVAGFVVPVAGIVCGHIVLAEYRKGLPERGREYALAGLILGYIFTAIWIVIAIIWTVFLFTHLHFGVPVGGGGFQRQFPGRQFPIPTPRVTPNQN